MWGKALYLTHVAVSVSLFLSLSASSFSLVCLSGVLARLGPSRGAERKVASSVCSLAFSSLLPPLTSPPGDWPHERNYVGPAWANKLLSRVLLSQSLAWRGITVKGKLLGKVLVGT